MAAFQGVLKFDDMRNRSLDFGRQEQANAR